MAQAELAAMPDGPEKEAALAGIAAKQESAAIAAEEAEIAAMPAGPERDKLMADLELRKESNQVQVETLKQVNTNESLDDADAPAATQHSGVGGLNPTRTEEDNLMSKVSVLTYS